MSLLDSVWGELSALDYDISFMLKVEASCFISALDSEWSEVEASWFMSLLASVWREPSAWDYDISLILTAVEDSCFMSALDSAWSEVEASCFI